MPLKIAVIYGSVRAQRQGIKAARFIVKKLKERDYDVTLIDPLEYKLPLLDRRYSDYEKGKAPETMEKLAHIFTNADGFVIVSGEYNHGIPPALKNILDHYYKEYFFKPAAIATYSNGSFGGVRAGEQLREVLGYLGMATIQTMFPVPMVQNAFDDEGNAIDKAYEQRIKQFIDEFEWYANALKEARKKGVPY
jgi:NAD(P)H-dependent FMN reductase